MSDTTIVGRYDRDAQDYAIHWGPVLERAALMLLDRVDRSLEPRHRPSAGPVRVLDIGTGTGVLALAAARRWPGARIVASDPSAGMLRVAQERSASLAPEARGRIEWIRASADSLPLADGSVDVAVSSFVLQLVPDRRKALGELLRVLRPGGRLALVTWLAERRYDEFEPALEFDEAVLDLDIEEPDEPEERRAGDFTSARAAADELRRAGFRGVRATAERLVREWTLESYLEYKLGYDERGFLESLEPALRERLIAEARRRLSRLPASAFVWRPGIVYVEARRPAR